MKVCCTSIGGYRNELTVVLTGLDIEAKAALFRGQVEAALSRKPAELTWTLARLDSADAPTQQQASALLTMVARDPDEKVAGRAFTSAAIELALGSYPGFFSTAPPGKAAPYGVFTAGFVPQSVPVHEVVLADGGVEQIAPPTQTQALAPHAGPEPEPWKDREGPTRRLPLGTLAGARSGDKGGDANIGLWVRDDAAYPWLANLITEEAVRDLLPEAADLPVRITRLPAIRAVNVVIEGLLGLGVAYQARFDPQAKGLGEWLRSRHVDIPESLLEEGAR